MKPSKKPEGAYMPVPDFRLRFKDGQWHLTFAGWSCVKGEVEPYGDCFFSCNVISNYASSLEHTEFYLGMNEETINELERLAGDEFIENVVREK